MSKTLDSETADIFFKALADRKTAITLSLLAKSMDPTMPAAVRLQTAKAISQLLNAEVPVWSDPIPMATQPESLSPEVKSAIEELVKGLRDE